MESTASNPKLPGGTAACAVPSRILLVGVGGMGINVLDHLDADAAAEVQCVAIDTDGAVLNECRASQRVQIGSHLTHGQSTGGSPELARRAANSEFVKIRSLFTDVDLVILVTGLGGGVGSGAAPVIAQTARDEGALVIGVAGLPFPFEGDQRVQSAERALDNLRRACQAVVTIPNQYLLEESGAEAVLTDTFERAARQLGAGFRILWKLLGQRNLINLDFITLKTMLEVAGGMCTLVYAEAGGKSRSQLALSRIMNHPAIQKEHVLAEANGLLIGLMGHDDMTMQEVQEIVHGITGSVHSNARRFMGVGFDDTLKGRIGVLLLVGGRAEETKAETTESEQPTRKLVTPARKDPVRKPTAEQPELVLEPVSKGRFKGVEPTLYEGEDLDLPTFIRRGLKLTR